MRIGLRLKSALALGLCMAVVLALAALTGWRAIHAIEESLGAAYARNVTRYNKQRILAPVLRELAVSQRLADSEITRRFLRDENNTQNKNLFFAEAERYRQSFEDKSYFVISATTRAYYFNDRKSKWSDKPRYFLKRNDPNDAWFFSTLKNTREFNINVDPDTKLHLTKVWFNILVKDGGRNVGLAGTGLDLTTFLERFISGGETGVTPMIVNREGAIQAHPNRKLIDYASVNEKGDKHSTIFRLLNNKSDHARVQEALASVVQQPEQIPLLWTELNGQRQLLAFAFIPELNWITVTAIDLQAAKVIDQRLWLTPLLLSIALLVLLMVGNMIAVHRIVLRPLLKLTDSARAVASGNYAIALPPAGHDELGELTRAFGAMASQVQAHTEELETKVLSRTQELRAVNEQMAAAHKKIGDSIEYASLIQNAILPNQELARALKGHYFVLWRPRDVVGGDFYLFHSDDNGCLLGVVDCAGHGVPGALMTMVAHSAFANAIDHLGLSDPAALLTRVDKQIHAMLRAGNSHSHVATNMDAGLAYIDFRQQQVLFAGAKISLYWCDGHHVEEIKGERYAIGGKRERVFSNRKTVWAADRTFYLTTDGLLDQAGGTKGFSFGNTRFAELIRRHASRSFDEQQQALADELAQYQGELQQRDDITVLSFRFDESMFMPDIREVSVQESKVEKSSVDATTAG